MFHLLFNSNNTKWGMVFIRTNRNHAPFLLNSHSNRQSMVFKELKETVLQLLFMFHYKWSMIFYRTNWYMYHAPSVIQFL